ncbi:hypothetical protein L6164_030202 [Bauhinia variegata]|uniref:Uncharacterized protein n=1 Tax=Bauhinia variegata TaxID=167791 RepID=A0ACB9LBW3_BAUVA|nr:hypothetical protein L6164_030202 [Bauhinia variegata]
MANETKQKNTTTMEEIIHGIVHGCQLVRQLEPNLFNLFNQPDMLSVSIDEIVKTFAAAKERLPSMSHQDQASSFSPMLPREAFKEEPPQQQQTQMGATIFMQEWLRSVDPLIQLQQVQAPIGSATPLDMRSYLESKTGMEIQKLRSQLQIGEMGGKDAEGSERSKGTEGDQVQPAEASSSRLRRSRKDEDEKKTLVLPANQFGNTDVPPEDGFTWRKYGQKEILGSMYPRSYYRCTHQKLYACPAKKQVQRVDDKPNFFAVTYRGSHTCHMSSTAPSSSVPPQILLDISREMTQTISPQLSPSSTSGSRWLQSSMHLSLHGSGGVGGGGDDRAAGPSTSSRYGKDREIDYGVADMADAMFNSGSSSGNSMESLFAPAEEWETGEKKSS